MECVCLCSSYDGEFAEVYHFENRRARKEHTCCECHEPIKKGDNYEYYTGLYDGIWSSYKTCNTCASIRDQMCCDGFEFGRLSETIWEALGIDYVTGECDEDD